MPTTRRRVLRSAAAVAGTATLGVAGASRSEEWSTTFDGGNDEYVDAVATLDEGYLVAGRSVADDAEHYWWLEVGPDGKQRASGTFDREEDGWIADVAVADDGVLIVGVDSTVASVSTWARRVGADGEHLWSYETSKDDPLQAMGAVASGDGEFALTGHTVLTEIENRGLARGLGADGTVTWDREFEAESVFRTVAGRPDGGVVLGGTRGRRADRSAWLVALDEDGTDDWQRTYDETPLDDSVGGVFDLHVEDGAIAMAVSVGAAAGVLGADAEGTLEWATSVEFEQARPAIARIDDGYVLGGSYVLADSYYEYFLANVGPDGDVRWASRYAEDGTLGDLVGAGEQVLVAGNDGRDAVVRTVATGSPPPGGDVTVAAGDGGTDDESDDEESGDQSDDGGSSDQSGDEETDDQSDSEETDDELPGFGVVTAAAGVAGAGLAWRRRRK